MNMFRKLAFVMAMGLVFSGSVMAYEKEISAMSEAVAEKIAESGKKTIAVVDFTDLQGNVTELGRFIAEEFSIALLGKSKDFKIVDRTHLKSLIKEHKLSETGLIDPKAARKLGEIAGVDALITGTITPFGENIRISAKVLDVSTAMLIAAKNGNIPKTGAITELINRSINVAQGAIGTQKTGSTSSMSSSSAKALLEKAQAKVSAGTIQTVTKNGLAFELKSCKRNGKTITFDMIITNNDKDKGLAIYRHYYQNRTNIFDSLSNEYIAKQVILADKSTTHSYAKHLMLKGLPTKAQLIFEEVATNAEFIAMLQLRCEASNKKFYVQFRNIPIAK